MFLPRLLQNTLIQALKHFPVLLLTGPRQTGKTELIKHTLTDFTYFSLDALDVRQKAVRDPRSFFLFSPKGIIIDEIQEVPELLSYVKEKVDQSKTPGQVVLTGSHQFTLMKGVTESLAGRVAILELLPFSYEEIKETIPSNLERLILRGMYPQVQTTPNLNLDLWFSSYINTYLERDLRSQIAVRDLRAFEAFLQLLAARVGQELNKHALSKEVGVKSQTIDAWLSALEAAYIVYLLPPYFQNFGKRVIKSPKIYFVDTGLACHLVKLKEEASVLSGPMAGALFENFVVMAFVKRFFNLGQKALLYFWRSHDGLEVDLILDLGSRLWPIEIKLSHTVTDGHAVSLFQFAKISKKKIQKPTIISPSHKPALSSSVEHIHWNQIGNYKI